MTEEEEIQLTVDVQAGMKDGESVKYEQVADEAVGHTPGDLIFIIKQIPHNTFTRQDDNLLMDMQITLLESLTGFRKTIQHVDGHEVVIEKQDVTYCTEVYRVRGEGMPTRGRGGRGDLLVTLHINFPRFFTPAQKELIKKAMA